MNACSTDVAMLETALERLIEAIDRDVCGIPGMPFSGNGGLVSTETIRAVDEARLVLNTYRTQDRQA